ncbi:MAG: dynamin family protein [Anaerovibrio sp.]|uniref:dynamin family protein n=1 Tax=Anaerovibrio sp. TaxID=1872532 RepID=UPI0025E7FF06|nr:dynamin family protein [Anaerovibrio sp.]MCR5175244.1 dynamin family protein [Anaerovibrio sp.]
MSSGIQQKKEKINSILSKLSIRDYVQQKTRLASKFEGLRRDIQNDYYTVVVLGEFKRGKSTFVNALLGESLLPMDILPETATINAIMYKDQPAVQVVHQDGRLEQGEPTLDYLKKFSARQGNNAAEGVRYIKIGYPSKLLKNRVILVDTPGVSDLDEQRCDVTYEFIPKANAVIFLLDANSPLKKTEKDFIDERLLPQGISNIMFLLNKYDAVDEEEEDEDLLETTQQRLSQAFNREIPVYPVSAKWALDGLEQGNNELIEASQIEGVRRRLEEMLSNGSTETAKITSWENRLKSLLISLQNEITNEKELCQMDKENIKKMLDEIESMLAERQQNEEKISQYIEDRKVEINIMVAKSLHHFNEQLKEDLLDRIEEYKGTEFKEFMETKINKRIQRQLEAWIGMYSQHINRLLKNMEGELATGMSYYFQQRIKIETDGGKEINKRTSSLAITGEDISNVTLHAGMIAAVGSIGLLAVVGGAIMPLMSFAALPILRDALLKKRLTEAKNMAVPEVQAQLARGIQQLQVEVGKYINERCSLIRQNTEYAYEQVLLDMRKQFQQQIEEQQNSKEDVERRYNNLNHEEDMVKSFLAELT